LGAEIITVSADTKFVHLAWKRDEGELANVKYKMGADPTGNVSRLFGVYDPDTGQAWRGTFIISPDGVLLSSEVNYNDIGRNVDELLRKVRANVYMSENDTEAIPAQWREEGDKTLVNPGPDMVGKVHEALYDPRLEV